MAGNSAERRSDRDTPVVVVGIDGSPDAAAALAWAVDYAGRFGAAIHAIHVWTPGSEVGDSPEQAMTRCAEVVRNLGRTPATVLAMVAEGVPGRILVDHSRTAILLAVGATGRGRYPQPCPPRVGATARYLTRHALCPVTVVGHDRRPEPIEEIPAQPWIPHQVPAGRH